jgi:hypothetical protein
MAKVRLIILARCLITFSNVTHICSLDWSHILMNEEITAQKGYTTSLTQGALFVVQRWKLTRHRRLLLAMMEHGWRTLNWWVCSTWHYFVSNVADIFLFDKAGWGKWSLTMFLFWLADKAAGPLLWDIGKCTEYNKVTGSQAHHSQPNSVPKTNLIIFWFLMVQDSTKEDMKHFCTKKKGLGSAVCVGGWICAISLPKRWLSPCMGTEMWLQIQISPCFGSQTLFWLNHAHYNKKGGWKFASKGLGAWACLLGKFGAFLETLENAFWPPSDCQETFSTLPRHALSRTMVWNAGVGPWWAATVKPGM